MKNYKKGFAGIIVVVIVALGILGFGTYKVINKTEIKEEDLEISSEGDYRLEDNENSLSQTEGGDCDIKVGSIPPNSQVSFPLVIQGVIHNSKKGCAWKMFEGQAGTAQLYFNYNNQGWKSVGESVPVRIENNLPKLHEFLMDLNFSNSGIGLPSGTPMKIIFTAENASGIAPSVPYEFPIILKSNTLVSSDTLNWKTYKNDEYGFELKHPSKWGLFQTWRPTIDGRGGVILGYRGEGDYYGINIQVFFEKDKLKESSQITKKYIVEREDFTYLLFPNNISDEEFDNVVSTFKFTATTNSSHPNIESITPLSGSIGTIVTLKGTNLAGFEGDLDAWIESVSGEKAYLPSYSSVQPQNNQITVRIDQKLCKQVNTYSGKSCTEYMTITPGTYKIYTSPWGVSSNRVVFEVK